MRAAMRGNRRRDTKPELAVRRLVHALGLRYRVDFPPLANFPRIRADLVFPRARVAVFIDGCYWHKCPEHYRPAVTNSKFWHEKIESNANRDSRVNELLKASDWTVLRFWEHEDPQYVAARIKDTVQEATRDAG